MVGQHVEAPSILISTLVCYTRRHVNERIHYNQWRPNMHIAIIIHFCKLVVECCLAQTTKINKAGLSCNQTSYENCIMKAHIAKRKLYPHRRFKTRQKIYCQFISGNFIMKSSSLIYTICCSDKLQNCSETGEAQDTPLLFNTSLYLF